MDPTTFAEIKKLKTLIKNAEHRKSIGKQYIIMFDPTENDRKHNKGDTK